MPLHSPLGPGRGGTESQVAQERLDVAVVPFVSSGGGHPTHIQHRRDFRLEKPSVVHAHDELRELCRVPYPPLPLPADVRLVSLAGNVRGMHGP